jgi:hypothetical protein
MIILTDEERERFAAYLEQSAASDDAMAKQSESMNYDVMKSLAKMLRQRAAAAMIIARDLRNTEPQTEIR